MAIEQSKGFGFTPIGKVKSKRMSWWVKKVIPKGVLAFISAPAKDGKTTLSQELAISLTTKRPFINKYPVKKRCRVLYISLEDHKGEFKGKIKSLLRGKGFPKNLYLSDADAMLLPENLNAIKADIEKSTADIVILDTLRRSHQQNEDSSSDMAPVINGLRKLVRECGVTVLVVHHTGHSARNPLRGTSDFKGAYEVLITITKKTDKVQAIVSNRYRSELKFEYHVIRGEEYDENIEDYPIVGLAYVDNDKAKHDHDDEMVTACLEQGKVSGNKMERELELSRDRIDKSLTRLSLQGKVKKTGRGKNTEWQLILDTAG